MWVSRYFVYFTIFSCMGWIYETIFCTIQNKKWQNRGFLYGPVCPIYGVGAASITAIADYFLGQQQMTFTWWQVFLIAFFGSIVLEYVTSWGLEKLFHAYWWDYSNVPLNINGRVCLPASIGFGVAGLLVIYVIAPATREVTDVITPIMMEFFSLICMGLLAIDATLTISALTNFEHNVEALDDSLNMHMDEFVNTIQRKTQTAGAVVTFGLEGTKQAAGSLLSEERARFARESMENLVRHMGSGHRAALARVKGFRSYNSEKNSRIRENFHQMLKKYIPKEKMYEEKNSNNS